MQIKLDKQKAAQLLDKFCAQLGFCLPPDEYKRSIIENPLTEVWQFVDAVFLAEGFASPELGDLRLRRQMRDMVLEASRASDTC